MSLEEYKEAILDSAGNISFKVQYSAASDFLRCAVIDFRASRTLNKERVYAPAVYYLQQATEKATKSLILTIGVLDEKELRKLVGHDTPMAFEQLLRIPGTEALTSVSSKMMGMPEDIISNVENDRKNKASQIRRLSYKKIEELMSSLIPESDKVMEQMLVVTNAIIPTMDMDESLKDMRDIVQVTCRLIFLGYITFPHWETTRYPDKDLKPWQYSKKLGIVRALPDSFKILQYCIRVQQKLSAKNT